MKVSELIKKLEALTEEQKEMVAIGGIDNDTYEIGTVIETVDYDYNPQRTTTIILLCT